MQTAVTKLTSDSHSDFTNKIPGFLLNHLHCYVCLVRPLLCSGHTIRQFVLKKFWQDWECW